MSEAINTQAQVEIDKALGYAVTLAWEEFKAIRPRSIRVEYVCEPGAPLNHLSVWSARAGGYQDLVFDYRTWTSSAHPTGARSANGRPEGLAQTLDFIMQHQNQFTRPPDAGRHGLVLIYPPAGNDCIEAAAWMRGIDAQEDGTSGEQTARRSPKRLEDRRQSQAQEASSRPRLREPAEGTAKTGPVGSISHYVARGLSRS